MQTPGNPDDQPAGSTKDRLDLSGRGTNSRKRKTSNELDDSFLTPADTEQGMNGPDGYAILSSNDGQSEFINRCKELKLSPPKAPFAPDYNKLMQLIKDDGFEEHLKQKDEERILLFLYGRGFHQDNEIRRKEDVAQILDKSKTAFKRIVKVIELTGDTKPENPEWANSEEWQKLITEAYTSTENQCRISIFDGDNRVTMVQRLQLHGSCFLQAPAVVQCYKVQKATGEIKMIDLCKYVRHSFDCNRLSRYIIKDAGGSSLSVLQSILQENKNTIILTGGKYNKEKLMLIKENIAKFGPALVSYFCVRDGFQDNKAKDPAGKRILPFFGPDHVVKPSKNDNMHAMVLAGARQTSDGSWRFLLQNWWPNMQFLEVSPEYFDNSNASLSWVFDEQTDIPHEFERCNSRYAEAFPEGADVEEEIYERT